MFTVDKRMFSAYIRQPMAKQAEAIITFRGSRDLKQRLERAALERDLTLTQLLRRASAKFLDDLEKGDNDENTQKALVRRGRARPN